jgi:hypothetical protein
MDVMEKAVEVLARAKRLGLHLEFDSGLLIAKRKASSEPEMQAELIAELGKYLSAVRRLVYLQTMGVRGKEFLGRRIWSAQGNGVLASASGDGDLTVTLEREGSRHSRTVTANAESLLIVLDEKETDGAASANDEPTPETPRKRRFGVF